MSKPPKVKRHSKHWFREFLRRRFYNGEPVAACVTRYSDKVFSIQTKRGGRFSNLLGSRQRMIHEVAAEFNATLIYGRRGGLWSAVYALPNAKLDEELALRALGEQVRPGFNEAPEEASGGIAGWQAMNRRVLHKQRNWYVRRWHGRPFLCIRIPREKRWYDIKGYLVK